VTGLAGERNLKHGGDESGGEAVAGNVRNEDADVLVVNLDEIVKITRYRSHWQIMRGDIQTCQLGDRVRKDGELNLASHLEFRVESQELRCKLGAGLAKKNVATHAGFDDGGRERLVDIVHSAHFEAASFILGASLASEKDDGDFACGRISFEAGTDFVAIHAGHHYVEEDEVGFLFGGGKSESFFAVGGDLGFVGILKSAGDHTDVEGCIVDDED
jgi:hypothetical protein